MKGEPILFSDMRGSIAGITFTKGIYPGVVARKKVSPVNPNTTPQSLGRSSFSGASGKFELLSAAEKAAWQVYAESVVYPGPMGEYTLSGRLSCMASMQFTIKEALQGGLVGDSDADPPIILGRVNLEGVTAGVFAGVAAIGVAISGTYNGAENLVIVGEVSRQFPTARNTFKGPFRSDSIQSVAIVSPASFQMEFDGLVEDAIYFIRIRAVTEDAPHRLSSAYIVRTIAISTII